MLSRFISKPSHFRLLTLISSKSQSYPPPHPPLSSQNPNFNSLLVLSRLFSTNHNNNNSNNSKDQSTPGSWKLSGENDGECDPFFGKDAGHLAGITDCDGGEFKAEAGDDESWSKERGDDNDIYEGLGKEFKPKEGGEGDDWVTAEGYKPWSLVEEEKDDDVFGIGEGVREIGGVGGESSVDSERWEEEKRLEKEENERLEKEEKELSVVFKGPNRAFGDLVAASGITDAMLDSLIALKDLEGVGGLPPLREIEDMRYEKNTKKSTRAEIERQKQEEVAKARVRQVDDKGRAYGTGRRKCSIARVWIQPGDGKFMVNEKQFDVYFPMLDHRAALLRPFSETKTLGLWDVSCTVKGGGFTGQVGAIQLGISRALQNWEPGLRPALKKVGFLTRDPRVVERKKPGKAKARKSFQWVKR